MKSIEFLCKNIVNIEYELKEGKNACGGTKSKKYKVA